MHPKLLRVGEIALAPKVRSAGCGDAFKDLQKLYHNNLREEHLTAVAGGVHPQPRQNGTPVGRSGSTEIRTNGQTFDFGIPSGADYARYEVEEERQTWDFDSKDDQDFLDVGKLSQFSKVT